MKIPLLFLIASILISGCGEPVSQPKAMLAENIKCPEGSSPEIERWGGVGENGWLQACKMKQGLFTAWHGEVKAVEGSYINGKEDGVWQFWNKDGKKYKEITYEHGKEISIKNFE
jgi:hypothetical protein